jgi:hypothetical protein
VLLSIVAGELGLVSELVFELVFALLFAVLLAEVLLAEVLELGVAPTAAGASTVLARAFSIDCSMLYAAMAFIAAFI